MLDHYTAQPARYYKHDHYYDFAPFFATVPKTARILNVGCGRGTSLREYPKGQGVDFNTKLFKLWDHLGLTDRCAIANVVTGLPWETWEFDWTLSSDFLEHLQPDEVDPALREIVRLAPSGKHVIDLRPESGYRGPNGENLHPSANNATFWCDAFKRAGVQKLSVFQRGLHLFVGFGHLEE